jgi:20S proteasome alpha/beta subunit
VTVIAFDGRTLAADKRAVQAGHAFPVQKVFRLDRDRLAGVSGNLGRAMAVVDWLRTARPDPDAFPGSDKEDEYVQVMVVHRDGRIRVYENTPHPFAVDRPFHAIGSGRDFAIVALHLGHTAVEAVAVTAEYASGCGNGCDALTFEAAKRRRAR